MTIDSRPTPATRARAEGASNAMSYIIGAVVIAAIAAVVIMFAFGEETPSGSTATSTGTKAPVTHSQSINPPSNTTTTSAQPSN